MVKCLCDKETVFKCEEKIIASTLRRTHSCTRRGTLTGETLIRHTTCVKLTAASRKVGAYNRKLGVNINNLISLTGSEPTKALFNVNVLVNIHKFSMCSRRIQASDLLRNVHFHYFGFITL